MKETIIKETNKLKGLKLRTAGRAAGMLWLGFGEMIPITRRGITEEGPEFALHIQCSWRLSANAKIVVAYQDFFVPRSDWMEEDEDFEWDIYGNNRFDERIRGFLNAADEALVVTDVEVDSLGGLKIFLSARFVLEVFPDSSDEGEYSEFWRLFNRRQNSPHLVVSGNGVRHG